MEDFNELLAAEMPQLRRYAQVLTRDSTRAEDLTQTCLLRALVKQDLWQAGTNLRSWLMTMMHNQHVSDIRRSARDGAGMAAWANVAPDKCLPHSEDALMLAEVHAAISQLPQCQQPIVILVCLEGLDYQHVAARLGIPEGTVRSRLSRARANLRSMLNDADTGGKATPPRQTGHRRERDAVGADPRTAFPRGFAAHPPARVRHSRPAAQQPMSVAAAG